MPTNNSALARCALFQNMSSEERQQVLELFEHEKYPQGETILREGLSIQLLWVLAHGKCEVVKHMSNGGEQQLAVLEPGSVFGEMSFFHPAPHSASVRTLNDVEVVRLSRDKYDQLIEKCPAAAYKLVHNTSVILADRLRKTDEWICRLVDRPDGAHHREEWHEFRSKLFSDWQF